MWTLHLHNSINIFLNDQRKRLQIHTWVKDLFKMQEKATDFTEFHQNSTDEVSDSILQLMFKKLLSSSREASKNIHNFLNGY